MDKLKTALLFIILSAIECYSQEAGQSDITHKVIKNGVSFGSVLAIVIS